MFFIFGWGRRTKDDLGPTLPLRCPKCRNDSYWRLVQLKNWFTLFFIPVLPYETKHVLLCEVCSSGIELKGPQIDKARALNLAATAYLNGQASEDNYKLALSEARLLG